MEEERYNRVKHWAGLPVESIRYVLREGGCTLADIDHVALSFNPKANVGRKALFTIMNRPSLRSILDRLQRQGKSLTLKQQLAEACGVAESEVRARIHNVEHHDAHIACGFMLIPFKMRPSSVSTEWVTSSARRPPLARRPKSPSCRRSSTPFVGISLQRRNDLPRFSNYGDEYKVMGLAPYGEPEYVDEFRKIIYPKGDLFELNLDYFIHPQHGINMSWDDGNPKVDPFHSPLLEQRLGRLADGRRS